MNFPARRKPFALLFCYGFAGVLAGSFATEAHAQASAPLRVDPLLLGLPAITPAQAPAPAAAPKPAPSAASEPVPEPSPEIKPVAEQGVEAVRDSQAPRDDDEEELRKRAKAAQSGRAPKKAESSSRPPSLKAPAPAPAAPLVASPERAPVPPAAPTPAAVVLPVVPVEGVRRSRDEPVAGSQPEPAPSTDNNASLAQTPAPTPVAAKPAARKPEPGMPSQAAAPAMAHSGTSGAISTLAPLRVDPALLGPLPAPRTMDIAQAGKQAGALPNSADRRAVPSVLPQSAAALAPASATRPPQVPATGPRDEEEVPDALPALALHASKTLAPLDRNSPEPRPVFLSAQRMGGLVDREFVAEGDAQLRKIGTVLDADRLTYWPLDDEIEAEGRVRLEQGDDLMTGPKMRLKLEDQLGYFEQPSYVIKRQPPAGKDDALAERFAQTQTGESTWLSSGFASPKVDVSQKKTLTATEAHGNADRLDFEGKNQFRLTNSTYTTCKPGDDSWYAKTSELKLDYDREVGDGKDATIYFKDIPILYSPWLSFSLNKQRKSGLLAPSFGTSTDSGIELSLPYYWNIAPNMDATITPRVMSKRGVMVNNEFRYLNTAYGGVYRDQARLEFLPDDKLRDGKNRYGFSLLHTQTTANGFGGTVNFNKVSDDDYYTDLSSGVASTSQINLLQQAVLSYGGGGWWSASANFQQYQTLQPDIKNPNPEQYKLLPQITVNARKPDWYMTDSSFMGQYTNFTKTGPTTNGVKVNGPDGQRTVLYPQLAIPYVSSGWYLTPKLGLNIRHYSLSGQAAGIPGSISSTLPIASVDSGMSFERQSNWFGKDYTQTLEPRLYYLNIPYKDQSQIPLFDTARADLDFAQIFSENQFSGWDRINSANQLTMAMTSRLLDPSTGDEIMRAMLGQRLYFAPNKVRLDSTIDPTDRWDKSDVLAAFSGQILPKVYADTGLQYNLADRQVKRFSMGAHYRPEPGKVLNASYRYYRDSTAPIDQIDLSGQWPISGRWHAVGRLNYSFKDDATNLNNTRQGGRMIESIAGLEYNAGCWAVRGVIQRTALTEDKSSTAFFIQLELTDFGQIGSNPLNLLKRNIQGYSQINQPDSETGFGE